MSTLLCLKEHMCIHFRIYLNVLNVRYLMLINILFKKLSNDREIQVMDYMCNTTAIIKRASVFIRVKKNI